MSPTKTKTKLEELQLEEKQIIKNIKKSFGLIKSTIDSMDENFDWFFKKYETDKHQAYQRVLSIHSYLQNAKTYVSNYTKFKTLLAKNLKEQQKHL